MSPRVILRPEAKRDLLEATSRYADISPELGSDFVQRIADAIELVRARPSAFQVVHRTFRRVLLRRFPYALFYHPAGDLIVVVAILHQARDPALLDKRKV